MSTPCDCPCGSGRRYVGCCEPLHDGTRSASTAEELMRSRFSAYARARADYLFRTWHPRTRPADVPLGDDISWRGLQIDDVLEGGVVDERGEVEFTAHYRDDDGVAAMHERSRFERRAGRWCYVDGDVD